MGGAILSLSLMAAFFGATRLLPMALGTVIEEMPGARRFQVIKTTPETLAIRLEAEPGADNRTVWKTVEGRLQTYLAQHF